MTKGMEVLQEGVEEYAYPLTGSTEGILAICPNSFLLSHVLEGGALIYRLTTEC